MIDREPAQVGRTVVGQVEQHAGAASVLSALVARVRVERERRLRAVTRVAEVAQRALLGGVAPALGSLRLAVLYASASTEASVGGDFYEALETPYGVRLLVGDVR